MRLVDVWFRYAKDKPWILKGVNLKIKKGDKITLLGESGSGKSTLLDILMGLLEPERGKILVDNKVVNSKNIAAWRKHISHVPQNIFLFDASIKQNITLWNEPAEYKSALARTIDLVELKDFISQLPCGLDTSSGEGGISISGGQKQRVGLARALFCNRDFYIIDEGTGALDTKTEQKVLNKVFGSLTDKTILFCSHSLESLNHTNKTVEIKSGIADVKTIPRAE